MARSTFSSLPSQRVEDENSGELIFVEALWKLCSLLSDRNHEAHLAGNVFLLEMISPAPMSSRDWELLGRTGT